MYSIYYEDGMVYSGEWNFAPAYGVIAVLDKTQSKAMLHINMDYYLLKNNTIISFNIKDLHQHLLDGILVGSIKIGKWIENNKFQDIVNKINHDYLHTA